MSNPFSLFNTNSLQPNQNSSLKKDDNNNNIFLNMNNNNNSNQQKENNPQNKNSNIFNNTPQSLNPFQNNLSTKNDSNNPFNTNSFTNNNQNQNNLNNINKYNNKNISIINTNKEINPNNISNDNFFNINNKIKEEPKKEEKKEKNNIFLIQSNNLLNKMNDDINTNKKQESKIDINTNNNEQKKPNFLLDDVSQILNQKDKKEEKKVDECIKGLLEEDNLVYSNKQMIEYQKNQLNTQTGEEILNDLKSALFEQKEQFRTYVKNTRLLEEKLYKICKANNENIKKVIRLQMRCNNISSKLEDISQNRSALEENIEKKNKNISEALDCILKNINNNNYNFMRREDFEKKNEIFNDMKETANKIIKIEDDINIISKIIDKNEQNNNDKELFFENKARNNRNNSELDSLNNNMEGVWVERNNNKIYVSQKETNEIFNECFSGLNSFKTEQDEIEKKCEQIKRKLLDKINKKNNNLGNNRQNNNYFGNINNIQGFNYGFNK